MGEPERCRWCGRRLSAATVGRRRKACSSHSCQRLQAIEDEARWLAHVQELRQPLDAVEPGSWRTPGGYIPPITQEEADRAIRSEAGTIEEWRRMP